MSNSHLELEPSGISTTELNPFGRCSPALMSCHDCDIVLESFWVSSQPTR